MAFDDIPEDLRESFPCEKCAVGNLILNVDKTAFECDVCNVYYELPKETK